MASEMAPNLAAPEMAPNQVRLEEKGSVLETNLSFFITVYLWDSKKKRGIKGNFPALRETKRLG